MMKYSPIIKMNLENKPKTDVYDILLNTKSAIEGCLLKGYLKNSIPCVDVQFSPNQMKIFVTKKYMNGYGYRCNFCEKERNILAEWFIDKPNISLQKYFRSVYKWF
ncbi:hypothetical protein DMUE_1279 [Dictyocoela muelleri]|nr:hypothetical protein DMUE_1279 [Dictyocoela muelleri]